MLCRNCRVVGACRPRGLCWCCYNRPEVRALFPSTSKFARRGVGTGNRCALPDEATPAPPGSAEKVAVLEERARLGVSLWHPADRPLPQLD